MTILDCSSPSSTTQSLSQIIGIEPADLTVRLRAFETDEFQYLQPASMWERIVGEPRKSGGIYWFHATRSLNPDTFKREGIHSLGDRIDAIWETVFELIGKQLPPEAKRQFRTRVESDDPYHHSWLYGIKVPHRRMWGPFAWLVRDFIFPQQQLSTHDYLRTPEIVEDICRCYQDWHGYPLLDDFTKKSRPCIVRFLGGPGDISEVAVSGAALVYLWAKTHNRELFDEANTCYDGRGVSVPPEAVIGVEVDPAQ